MSVNQKIYSIVFLVFLTSITIATTGIVKMVSVVTELEEITEADIPLTEVVTNITLSQLEQSILLERALRSSGVDDEDEFEQDSYAFIELTENVNTAIELGKSIAVNTINNATDEVHREKFAQVLSILEEIETQHKAYEQDAFAIINLIKEGGSIDDDSYDLILDIEEQQIYLEETLETLLINIDTYTDEAVERALNEEREAIVLMFVFGGLCIVIGLGLGLVIGRNITVGLNQIIRSMKDISKDKLDKEIPCLDRKDEIGDMAQAVDIFKQNAVKIRVLEEEKKNQRRVAEDARYQALQNMADAVEKQMDGSVTSILTEVDEVSSIAAEISTSENLSETSSEKLGKITATSTKLRETISNLQHRLNIILDEGSKATSGRNNNRYDVSINGTLTIDNEEIKYKVTNIANNGMLVTSDSKLKKGAEGLAQIDGISMQLPARIRGQNDDGTVRISFDDLSEETISKLDKELSLLAK